MPFREWHLGLKDRVGSARIDARIARLRSGGSIGHVRSAGYGVIELKDDYGPGYRIYFALDGDTVVLLLCGGDKGTQQRDIKAAKSYWLEYQSRKKESNRNAKKQG